MLVCIRAHVGTSEDNFICSLCILSLMHAFHQVYYEALLIAMLFSGCLDSEKEMKEHFLPAMETIATTELKGFRVVTVYMLVILLHKMPENAKSLATNVLPSEVCNY